jgi:fructose transport system substrate-binding protein
MTLKSYAGKIDGDHESQVAAIEACIADGAKGILITASDTKAIVDSVKAARDAGLLVIALDTPLDPIDAADATFATDNFQAGLLIGQWAKATLGDEAANAKIALAGPGHQPAFGRRAARPGLPDRLRHRHRRTQQMGRRDRPAHRRPRSHRRQRRRRPEGDGSPSGQGPDINVVYTINEPSAAGAYEALKAAGKEGVLIVSVDGGCPGVAEREGRRDRRHLAAISAADGGAGVEAIAKFAADGTKPARPKARPSSTPAWR